MVNLIGKLVNEKRPKNQILKEKLPLEPERFTKRIPRCANFGQLHWLRGNSEIEGNNSWEF